MELSVYLYKDLYKSLEFLQDKSSSFLAWICPLFKPIIIQQDRYVYFEGDPVDCIYFVKKGDCGMVLPKHENTRYVDYKVGNTFGVVDIIGSTLSQENMELDEWFLRKDLLKR